MYIYNMQYTYIYTFINICIYIYKGSISTFCDTMHFQKKNLETRKNLETSFTKLKIL